MPDLVGFLLGGGSLVLLALIFAFVDDLSDGNVGAETNLVGGYGPQPKPNPERQAANDDRPPAPKKGIK